MSNTDAIINSLEGAAGLSDADKAKLAKLVAKGGGAKRTTETELRAKYPHVIEGTLEYDAQRNKQSVLIQCSHPGCEEQRRVFTSDLFQVSMCEEHKKEAKKAKRDAIKALAAQVREAAKSEA